VAGERGAELGERDAGVRVVERAREVREESEGVQTQSARTTTNPLRAGPV
jgi:hypothetical protein